MRPRLHGRATESDRKMRTGRLEAAQPETERRETGQPEAARLEIERRETGRSEAARRETERRETGRPETEWLAPAMPEPVPPFRHRSLTGL